MMLSLVIDGKTQYPAACNSTEKVMLHKDVINSHLQPLLETLVELGVIVHLQESLHALWGGNRKEILVATKEDFQKEYVGLEITIGAVASLEQAIEHINETGSHHTDCIITASLTNADKFMAQIDSAGVFWNCSTRFADGVRYGFGAEIGVSTNKTHARGPVGMEGLLIYKYRIYGHGQIVDDYSKGKKWNRKELQKVLPAQSD